MPSLREQQLAFARAAFDRSDAGGLPNIRRRGFSTARRLRIYHNNIHINLRTALTAVYPVTCKLVGEEFFHHLAAQYIPAHPSASGNIHDFGRELPGFIANFPGTQSLPYLPDVAGLEWAYHAVFHATAGEPFDPRGLAELEAQQLETLHFTLTPACYLIQSAYPVLAIWQAHQGATVDSVDLDAGGIHMLVLRHEDLVEFHPLSIATYALVFALQQGRSFTEACAEALAADAGCNMGAQLQYLTTHRIISGYTLHSHHGKSS